jgi:acyl-CoA thioesterase
MSNASQLTLPATSFDHATAVRPEGDGRYIAALDPDWDGPFGPNGGYIAAVLLRAGQYELARPELPPRIINVHYLRTVGHEPARVSVHVLREGRNNATVRVAMRHEDRLTAMALITHSAARPQAMTMTQPAPTVPRPEEIDEIPVDELAQLPPSFSRLRMRPCFGAPLLSSAPDAVTGGWVSFRDDNADADAAYDAARLTALSDLWWPAVFPAADRLYGAPTLELSVHLRASAPVRGPILARFTTNTIAEGHLDEVGQLWSPTGQLLAESRQLALLTEPPSTLQPT